MKKRCFDERTDLRHMDHRQALVISRGISGKTNAEVATAMGLGEETVARYQRDPAPGEHSYDLPLNRIPLWCKAVGNNLLPRWIAQQCGGIHVQVDGVGTSSAEVTEQIGRVNREAGDVINALIVSLKDGVLDQHDKERMEKELMDLRVAADEALIALRGRMALA